MSHVERRQEIEEWDVEVCDACGHDRGDHYVKPRTVVVRGNESYIASGCMVLKTGGRELPGTPGPNPYRRCLCTEFT